MDKKFYSRVICAIFLALLAASSLAQDISWCITATKEGYWNNLFSIHFFESTFPSMVNGCALICISVSCVWKNAPKWMTISSITYVAAHALVFLIFAVNELTANYNRITGWILAKWFWSALAVFGPICLLTLVNIQNRQELWTKHKISQMIWFVPGSIRVLLFLRPWYWEYIIPEISYYIGSPVLSDVLLQYGIDMQHIPFELMMIAMLFFAGYWLKKTTPNIEESVPSVLGESSNTDKLKLYQELLDSDIITQEEFEEKKKQVLGL